jgi:O-antigen ligase
VRTAPASRLPLTPVGAMSSRMASFLTITFAAVGALTIAYLVAGGRWYLATGLLLVVPVTVLVYRFPLSVIVLWLLVQPFVVDITSGGGLRKLFWVVHRALPPLAVALILITAAMGLRRRPLPKLGWAEVMMGGYIIATLVSIVYTSDMVLASMYHLYDRAFVPMCLYLIIRLIDPDEEILRVLVPALVFLVISQAVFGMLSWYNPEALPDAWLGRAGDRTTGSLRSVSAYTTTLIFGAVFLVHWAMGAERRRVVRVGLVAVAAVAPYMVFLSFSRGSWLAAFVVAIGLLFVYPRLVLKVAVVAVPVFLIALSAGMIQDQLTFAEDRVTSEAADESALSRLPVVLASVRMFEERPVTGFGFGNFDRFDREFQGQVGDLVVPEKDHASHNLYLTLLAEQGLIGFALFIGPVFWWLVRLPSAARNLPRTGFRSRQLLLLLWLVIAAHIIVNNFSNMRNTFGLGMWWITLGLIAVMTVQGLTPGGGFPVAGEVHDEGELQPGPRGRK